MAPKQLPVPVVTDLRHQIDGDQVTLTWSLPPSGGGTTLEVAGFYINRFKGPLDDAQCTDCPVVFERVAEMTTLAKPEGGAEKLAMTYTDPVEKGYRYVYNVTVFTPSETEGQTSNWVDFLY